MIIKDGTITAIEEKDVVKFADREELKVTGAKRVGYGALSYYYPKFPGRVNIGRDVESISYEAFANCLLNRLDLTGSSVTTIDEKAFRNCPELKQISFNGQLKEIGTGAFEDCVSLKDVKCNIGLESIGVDAFKGCSSLKTAQISCTVSTLNAQAFADCKNLEKVKIDNNPVYGTQLKGFGTGAFKGCTSLKTIELPAYLKDGNEYRQEGGFIGAEAFSGCWSLESIAIPVGVDRIRRNAFEWCISLKTVTIPNTVKQIDENAFLYCKALEEVTIPESVTSIGEGAFAGCASLKKVVIPEHLKEECEKNGVFAQCPKNLKIVVKKAPLVDRLKSAITGKDKKENTTEKKAVKVDFNKTREQAKNYDIATSKSATETENVQREAKEVATRGKNKTK